MMDKNALYKLTYGLYVVGVKTENGYGGSIVDAVAQVSAGEPPMVVLSSMKRNLTNARIHAEGGFTLSVLPADVDPFVVANFGFQSARDVDKWANVPHTMKDGLPVLDGAAAWLRCKVVDLREFDTHTMFITETADAWTGAAESAPLVYADYLRDMKDAAFAAFQRFQSQSGL